MTQPVPLSKTKFLIGRQCDRRLWLSTQISEPALEPEEVWTLREEEGSAVEKLVESLFDNSIRIAECPDDESCETFFPNADELAERTRRAMLENRPIFQAYFLNSKTLAVVDILEPKGNNTWFLWEVKASTGIVPLHIYDLAYQVTVARQAGVNVIGAGVWLLNGDYVRGDELEVKQLLVPTDKTEEVELLAKTTDAEIQRQLTILGQTSAPIAIPGKRCRQNRKGKSGNRPSDCGHLAKTGYCRKDLPNHWNGDLINLSASKSNKLTTRKSSSIENLNVEDEEMNWTKSQRRMINSVKSNSVVLDCQALQMELKKLKWPVTYVDFEFDPGMAIPRFAGSWPYARIPFQWSMHIQRNPNADLEQPTPFLWLDATDPRKDFLDSLLEALPGTGSIVVHSKNAELTVFRQLATFLEGDYPDRIADIENRVFDTLELLKAGYYHPEQHGSYSIKRVAPLLVGMGYDDIEIQSGMTAVIFWKSGIDPDLSDNDRKAVRQSLLDYCSRDTILIHKIIAKLSGLCLDNQQ